MAGEAMMQTSVGILKKILQALTGSKIAVGKQTLTVTTASLGLSPTSGSTSALIQVESNVTTDAIRYWEDGATPTSTVGFFQANGAIIELNSAENIRNFKVIQGTGGTTQLNIIYYK